MNSTNDGLRSGFKQFFEVKRSFELAKNVLLARHTTLKIGGNARFFVRAETERQVADAFEYAENSGLNLFVLGGGSNVLISDRGFDGLVLWIQLKGISFEEGRSPDNELRKPGETVMVTANAGEDWDDFVAHCVSRNLAGVECLSGIPGFVGGTPVQNVGAYGQEVSETIVAVRCLDRETNEIVTLNNANCNFTYRTSIFNSTQRDRFIVLRVTFALKYGGEPTIAYKDLIECFEDRRATLQGVRDAVLKIRRAKSMVIDPDDPNSRSAGSFFKNPVVDRKILDQIRGSFETVPYFEFGEKVKIPAAWLIENAGFYKGFAVGGAGISLRHTLALVNRDNATASEIIALKQIIQDAVAAKFGIGLHTEPVFIGF